MATVREMYSDLELCIQRFKLSKDFVVGKANMIQLINRKRERQVYENFERNGIVDPTWLQRCGVYQVAPVSIADDPNVPASCKKIGRITIPAVISLMMDNQDLGVYRIAKQGNGEIFHHTTLSRFSEMDFSVEQFRSNLRFRVGNEVYLHPYFDKVTTYLILQNPMDGIIVNTSFIRSGYLIVDDDYTSAETYVVYDAAIVHDGVTYNPGDTFVATKKDFTGAGKVKLLNEYRKMNIDDPYPMSLSMANTVIMRILSEDLKLTERQIADIKNDGNAQLNILGTGE